MQDYERLGVFYLGKLFNLDAGRPHDDLLLYDSKDLTTHAVCVGMTGSGKTGLCLALLEEAAIDGIPALIIDPKGDLGNLLLTFPQLRPEDFAPWIDPADATRAGQTPAQYAAKTAERWKTGLADWGQPPERIQRFRDAAEVAIYTPGSSAGLPLTVLRSFDAPPASTLENAEALRDMVAAAASGLLGLLGIDADPLRSREHILLANIFDRAWRAGQNLDMGSLIRAIQTPPLDKVGVMDLESFFPAKDRFDLAMQLNNLLASPGFSTWMEGEPLDIQKLLYTPAGKPRLAILSIAHLSDAERMFFVTILLSEVIAWMRAQSGTSSLRALLYMDEVFGYFPPSKNPPSKTPMLTLLKQARAYGLGIVLATQNPVDLDYKGLANCGTWLLGRLQTERDKLRVLDGLEGASTAAGASFDRAKMERVLSGLGNRVFLMNNVHEDQPVVFQTRWALSYLRGPLTREQIGRLMADRKTLTRSDSGGAQALSATEGSPAALKVSPPIAEQRPVLPPEISERFSTRRANLPSGASVLYRPALLGTARVHFTQTTAGIDEWQEVSLLLAIDGPLPADIWGSAEPLAEALDEFDAQPENGAKFAELPGELSRPKRYGELAIALKDYLYRNQRLSRWKCPAFKQISNTDETEAEFRVRLGQAGREQRDLLVEKLRQKYAPKLAALQERIRKAEIKVEKEKSQATQQTMNTVLSVGTSILGALFSRKLTSATNVTRAASSMRQAGKIARERQDISDASEGVAALNEQMEELNTQLQAETEKLQAGLAAETLVLEEISIVPKKADITTTSVALVWQPWIVRMDGAVEPGV
ncbi:MAG: DUF87 domain-containing protein [Pirellulaceae bacterium]|nr:DUF87 domain-containing protein [Pirellulaceae bacterium]